MTLSIMNVGPDGDRSTGRAPIRKRFADAARNFLRIKARQEDGSIAYFAVYMIVLMIGAAGLGVDFMRFERERAKLQAYLDQAVLAGASLRQSLDAEAVVRDFMEKSDINFEYNLAVSASEGLNYRDVTATATTTLDTIFLDTLNIATLDVVATSTASERIPNIEISLVLDVSGSMANNSRLTNLKSAANDFVSTMIEDSGDSDVVISIIPFSSAVSPNQSLYDALTVNETHTYSRCLEFDAADFSENSIAPDEMQEQVVYTALYTSWENFQDGWSSCLNNDYYQILPYQDSVSTLQAKINSLQANGSTAGHVGIKWGLALLHPDMRKQKDVSSLSPTANMIAEGDVNAAFANVPVDFTNTDTMKVIVMMSDGENWWERRFGNNYRGANSDVYYTFEDNSSAGGEFLRIDYNFSSWYSTNPAHEWACSAYPHYYTCTYSEASEGTIERYYIRDGSWYYNVDSGQWTTSMQGDTVTRLNWEEAWGKMPIDLYRDVTNSNSAYNDWLTYSARSPSEANTLMQASCTAAKTQGITIFTIGFETNNDAEYQLETCASSSAHFYSADGIEIATAFNAIANSIQKLRLTQ